MPGVAPSASRSYWLVLNIILSPDHTTVLASQGAVGTHNTPARRFIKALSNGAERAKRAYACNARISGHMTWRQDAYL